MTTYDNTHAIAMLNGTTISLLEKTQFSSVPMFRAFATNDMDMKKVFVIVTYSGLTNYPSMFNAAWKGVEGVDCFHFTSSDEMVNKMNELSKEIVNA